METNAEREQYLADILLDYPDLIDQLKTPERKKKDKATIYEEFKGEKDDNTGKYRYANRQDAQRALQSCKSKRTAKRKETRIYQDIDGYWYLTSQAYRGARKKKKKMKRTTNTFNVYGNKPTQKKYIKIRTNIAWL